MLHHLQLGLCVCDVAFLSYLRLSVYMAIVSVAITLSFHLKNEATPLELRMAKPLGTIFWALSVMTLCAGMANYISEFSEEKVCVQPLTYAGTVNRYSNRAAIVQIGWKTHAVSFSPSTKRLSGRSKLSHSGIQSHGCIHYRNVFHPASHCQSP